MIAIGATVRIERGRRTYRVVGFELGGEVLQLEGRIAIAEDGDSIGRVFSVWQWRVRYA